ncbi:MAG: hypothetical protein ACI828_002741 [Flavobacteriales bacterium]|jgi:hypothetical protein
MKNILAFLATFFIFSSAFSQTLTLEGSAVTDENDYLLPHTQIMLISGTDTIIQQTNYSGIYAFKKLKPGRYNIHAEKKDSNRFKYDTVISIFEPNTIFHLRMKAFDPPVWKKTTYLEFNYRKSVDCNKSYFYTIKRDSIILNQGIWSRCKGNKRTLNEKKFEYALTETETKAFDRLVESNRLDLVDTYQQRVFSGWSKSWRITIERQSITYTIDLPNYHNQGLEEILKFASDLVPKEEKFDFTR